MNTTRNAESTISESTTKAESTNPESTTNAEIEEIEIKIEKYPKDQNFNKVTIDDKISPPVTIQTMHIKATSRKGDDLLIKEWIRKIKNGSSRRDACNIIGLSADCSLHYRNGNSSTYTKDDPLEILQLCVGNHCLFYEPRWYDAKDAVPRALKELLGNDRFEVVGVGIERVAKKLESQLGLKISRPRDLRTMAASARHVLGYCYWKYSLEKYARKILGGNWRKPPTICWMNDERRGLSDDKIKYGTVEAFLAYQMGKKLLKY